VPTSLPGVEPHILDPIKTWADKAEFDKTARALLAMFQKNFAKFETRVDAEIRAAAPEAKLAAEKDSEGSRTKSAVERNYARTKKNGD
jgi:phosphoenolpyruvate carboxykinase (ATP)